MIEGTYQRALDDVDKGEGRLIDRARVRKSCIGCE